MRWLCRPLAALTGGPPAALTRCPPSLCLSLALLTTAAACVSNASSRPCSPDGRCLPGFDCVEKVCVPCNADDCQATEVTLVGVGGGLACGPDRVCVRIPRNALSSQIEVKITRLRDAPTIPGQTVLSKLYGIEPSGVQFFQPIQVTIPISRFTIDLARVAVFRTDSADGVWTPLPGDAEIGTVTGTTTELGFFAGATEFGTFGDGGVNIPDAGPAMNPLDGIQTPMVVVRGTAANQLSSVAWDPVVGRMLVVDRPNDIMYGLPAGAVVPAEFRRPSGQARGVAVDTNGRVYSAEYAQRRVTRVSGTGQGLQVLADRFEGQRFNGPHDLAIRLTDNVVYFTDSPEGLMGAPREIQFNGVFRYGPGDQIVAEYRGDAMSTPTGIGLSPDFRVLYVCDTTANLVRAFDVNGDGSLSNPRVFAMTGAGPSGVTTDAQGNVYVGSSMGLQVFPPTGGEAYGALMVTGGIVDVAFGGMGLTTLYGTSGNSLLAARVRTPGAH